MLLVTRHRTESLLTKTIRNLLEGYQRLIELPGAWKTVLELWQEIRQLQWQRSRTCRGPSRNCLWGRTSRTFGPMFRFEHWKAAPSWLNLNLVLVSWVGKSMALGYCPTKLWVRSHFSKGTRVLIEKWMGARLYQNPQMWNWYSLLSSFVYKTYTFKFNDSEPLFLAPEGMATFSSQKFHWQLSKTKYSDWKVNADDRGLRRRRETLDMVQPTEESSSGAAIDVAAHVTL